MLFKSRERQVHEHISQELEARLARSGAPREIRLFLLERWSYLLAGIYFSRGDQNADWEAGWHTVNALLWSLTPKRDLAETEQFLRLLPTLLSRLQDGCDAMNLPLGERDELFSLLALLHAAVSRAGLQAGREAMGPTTQLGRDADLEFTEEELAALGSEPVPVEPVTTEPVTTGPVTTEPVTTGPVTTGPSAVTEPGESAVTLDSLKIGDVLHLRVEGQDKTLYVQWISPMGGMFLFADPEGYDAVSLTRVRLVEKLAKGEARLGK